MERGAGRKLQINKAEDTTIKAYATEREVLIKTETKIKQIANKIEQESKEAIKGVNISDSTENTVGYLKKNPRI